MNTHCAVWFESCAYTTCHHPRPEPPSQSERGAGGLRGPPGPSGMSDCCCSCQGNRARRFGHRWHFLSCLHRMLYEKKDTEVRTNQLEGWAEKSNGAEYSWGFREKPPSEHRLHRCPADCGWVTLRAVHLGVRECDCVWWTCKGKSQTQAQTLSVRSSCRQPQRKTGTGRWALSSRRRIVM